MAPTSNKLYALFRTDYLDAADSEGRDVLLSLHATPALARAALDTHLAAHSSHLGLDSPNTKPSTYDDNLFGTLVMVGHDDYHSFDLRVHEETLHGGHVVADKPEAAKKRAAAAKDDSADAPADKPKRGGAKLPATAKPAAETADGDVDISAPPEGDGAALAGMKIMVTGTLEGVTRAGVQGLIEGHGGEFVKALGQADLVVIGVRAGPKKVDEIKEKGIRTVDQAGFYAMIEGGGTKRAAPGGQENGEGRKKRKA